MIKIEKSDFKELYDIACKDWKKKFDDLFKEYLFSDTLEFSDGLIKEMKNACNLEQLSVFNKIFKDYISDDIYSFNTYSKICKALNEAEYDGRIISYTILNKDTKKTLAYLKIQQIARFFNKEWIPDFSDNSQYKYYPYFENEKSSLVFRYSGYCSCYFGGKVAFYKSKEISDFVGKTFVDIYKDLV